MCPVVSYFYQFFFTCFFFVSLIKKTNRQQSNDQQIEKATPGTIFLQEYGYGQSNKDDNRKYEWYSVFVCIKDNDYTKL